LSPSRPERPSMTSSSKPNQTILMTSAGNISLPEFHFASPCPSLGCDGRFRVSVPRFGILCGALDLGALFSGDFEDRPFGELQSPDAGQADASLHILFVLCCDDPSICSELIASRLLHLFANCEPSSPFGSLVSIFYCSPNPLYPLSWPFCHEFFSVTIQSVSSMG
jgi:hypothetical protein